MCDYVCDGFSARPDCPDGEDEDRDFCDVWKYGGDAGGAGDGIDASKGRGDDENMNDPANQTARLHWSAGTTQTLTWTGGKNGGEVVLEFRLEGGNWIDGSFLLTNGASNPLPNTGAVELRLPMEMPATCALEFQLTSASKDENQAYTLDVAVKTSSQRHSRVVGARLAAWSPGPWGDCSKACGGGQRD